MIDNLPRNANGLIHRCGGRCGRIGQDQIRCRHLHRMHLPVIVLIGLALMIEGIDFKDQIISSGCPRWQGEGPREAVGLSGWEWRWIGNRNRYQGSRAAAEIIGSGPINAVAPVRRRCNRANVGDRPGNADHFPGNCGNGSGVHLYRQIRCSQHHRR